MTTINITTRRDGSIVSHNVARELIANGWELSNITQVIDGVSYVILENDDTMDECLFPLRDIDSIRTA